MVLTALTLVSMLHLEVSYFVLHKWVITAQIGRIALLPVWIQSDTADLWQILVCWLTSRLLLVKHITIGVLRTAILKLSLLLEQRGGLVDTSAVSSREGLGLVELGRSHVFVGTWVQKDTTIICFLS